jgi:hypothetical protein
MQVDDSRQRIKTCGRHPIRQDDAPVFYFFLLLRHRRKRLAFCLSVSGFVSPSIGQALASDALQYLIRARVIVVTKLNAVAVAKSATPKSDPFARAASS